MFNTKFQWFWTIEKIANWLIEVPKNTLTNQQFLFPVQLGYDYNKQKKYGEKTMQVDNVYEEQPDGYMVMTQGKILIQQNSADTQDIYEDVEKPKQLKIENDEDSGTYARVSDKNNSKFDRCIIS